MAKVAARTSKEYLDILNSGDMLIISNHDVLNYISDLGAAERMPPGANRTRKINKLNKELNVIFGFEPTTSIKPEVIPTQSTTKSIFFLCEHLGENAPTTRYPRSRLHWRSRSRLAARGIVTGLSRVTPRMARS